jgi:trigger factor
MESLKVETQDLQERQLQMTVEVPDDRLASAMRAAARRLSGAKRIPGFRPGKAPYEIILQKFGEEAVFEEAIDPLGKEVYRQALDSASIEPSAPGSFDQVVSRNPLVLRYTVPLAPKVDLGAYRDLRLPFEEPQVTDEALEAFLEELRQSQALIEPAERPAHMGDVVVVDVVGKLLDPGPKEGSTLLEDKGVSVLLAEGTNWPVAGIADQLIGLSAGEERTAEHTFPADYTNESLRGRRASFRFQCQAVKSRTVPEWTDDVARNLGEFQDLLDLRVKARDSLKAQHLRQAEEEYASKVVEAAVEGAQVEYPPALIGPEIDVLVDELDRRLREQKLRLADYLKIEKKTLEELRKDLEPRARTRLKRSLVITTVMDQEKIEVTDEDVEAELARLLQPWKDDPGGVRRALESPAGRRRIALDLLSQKTVERLAAIARGQAPEPSPSAGAPDPEPSPATRSETTP